MGQVGSSLFNGHGDICDIWEELKGRHLLLPLLLADYVLYLGVVSGLVSQVVGEIYVKSEDDGMLEAPLLQLSKSSGRSHCYLNFLNNI